MASVLFKDRPGISDCTTVVSSIAAFDALPWKGVRRAAIASMDDEVPNDNRGILPWGRVPLFTNYSTNDLLRVLEQYVLPAPSPDTGGQAFQVPMILPFRPFVGKDRGRVAVQDDRKTKIANEIIESKRAALKWDRDGDPPPQEAFDDALAFLDVVPIAALNSLSRVYSSGDAEVGFLWRTTRAYLEIAFSGGNSLDWAAAIEGVDRGGEAKFDRESRATRLPEPLERALDRLVTA